MTSCFEQFGVDHEDNDSSDSDSDDTDEDDEEDNDEDGKTLLQFHFGW